MGNAELFVYISGGLVLLVVGGELLIRGATAIALTAGVSSLVIGLTVVAFGTSMPEMVVSIEASIAGSPEITLGNVVGSNIFNIFFVLGVCGIIAPLSVSAQVLRLDIPVMVGGAAAIYLFALNGALQRWQAVVLLGCLIAYTLFIIHKSRSETRRVKAEFAAALESTQGRAKQIPLWLSIVFVIGGLLTLVLGARLLVTGAVALARTFGVADAVIGLTVVAAGTSLPEVAASAVATYRGERDIAIGNIVGSNTFNLLGILGVVPLISGNLPVSEQLRLVDLPWMLAASASCIPFLAIGLKFGWVEGLMFLLAYFAYLTLLVLASTGNPAHSVVEKIVFSIVLPLLLSLGVLVLIQRVYARRRKA